MAGLFNPNRLAGPPMMGGLFGVTPNRLSQPRRPKTLVEVVLWQSLKHGDVVPEWLLPFAAWVAIAQFPHAEIAWDRFGNQLNWAEYGLHTKCGWEVDHHPIAQTHGGRHVIGNLQALHWHANATLGGLLGASR